MFENMFEKALKKEKRSTMVFFLLLDKPRSYITVNLIFYAPNVANLGFLRIVPTIAL